MVQQTLADYINTVLHSEYTNEVQDFNDDMLLNIDSEQNANTIAQKTLLPPTDSVNSSHE